MYSKSLLTSENRRSTHITLQENHSLNYKRSQTVQNLTRNIAIIINKFVVEDKGYYLKLKKIKRYSLNVKNILRKLKKIKISLSAKFASNWRDTSINIQKFVPKTVNVTAGAYRMGPGVPKVEFLKISWRYHNNRSNDIMPATIYAICLDGNLDQDNPFLFELFPCRTD